MLALGLCEPTIIIITKAVFVMCLGILCVYHFWMEVETFFSRGSATRVGMDQVATHKICPKTVMFSPCLSGLIGLKQAVFNLRGGNRHRLEWRISVCMVSKWPVPPVRGSFVVWLMNCWPAFWLDICIGQIWQKKICPFGGSNLEHLIGQLSHHALYELVTPFSKWNCLVSWFDNWESNMIYTEPINYFYPGLISWQFPKSQPIGSVLCLFGPYQTGLTV